MSQLKFSALSLAGLLWIFGIAGAPCAAMQQTGQLDPKSRGAAFVLPVIGAGRWCSHTLLTSGELHRQRFREGPAVPTLMRCRMGLWQYGGIHGGGAASGGARREPKKDSRAARSLLSASTGEEGDSNPTWLQNLTGDSVFMRLLAWSSFALVLHLVSDFYAVIAGTFILSFVGNSVVHLSERTAAKVQAWGASKGYSFPCPTRRMLSVAYVLVLLSVLSIGSCITVPLVFDSWRYLKSVLLSDNPYVELANSIYLMLGPEATSRVERSHILHICNTLHIPFYRYMFVWIRIIYTYNFRFNSCMYLCKYICVHAHTFIITFLTAIYTHAHIHKDTPTHTRAHSHTRTHTQAHKRTHEFSFLHLFCIANNTTGFCTLLYYIRSSTWHYFKQAITC